MWAIFHKLMVVSSQCLLPQIAVLEDNSNTHINSTANGHAQSTQSTQPTPEENEAAEGQCGSPLLECNDQ